MTSAERHTLRQLIDTARRERIRQENHRRTVAQIKADGRYTGTNRVWTEEKILGAFHRHCHVYGKPPTTRDWSGRVPGVDHPSERTVRMVFGSFSGGARAAGVAFGVNQRTISRVLRKEGWAHVED